MAPRPPMLQAAATPIKAGALTPRDVFDDLHTPSGLAAAAQATAVARGSAGSVEGAADGTIKSHRAYDSPPLTGRSDVFDFVATPRTEAVDFGPLQVGLGVAVMAGEGGSPLACLITRC
jgi:hypothetical protein